MASAHALTVITLGLLAFGSYLVIKWFSRDDPCDPKNQLLLYVKEPERELKQFEPSNSFPLDQQRPQTPPGPGLFRCSLTIINRTGKPIRLWRYLPHSIGKVDISNSSKEPAKTKNSDVRTEEAALDADQWSDISAQPQDQVWIPTFSCEEVTPGLNAIGGWSYVWVDNLDESLETARHRTGSPDDANPRSLYLPGKGWFYFPYGKKITIEIEKLFFEHPQVEGNFVLTTE